MIRSSIPAFSMANNNATVRSLEQFRDSLTDEAMMIFSEILNGHTLLIKHVRKRNTKLGDFKSFGNKRTPEITINRQLSQDALTFILAHEISHYLAFCNRTKSTKPHGPVWQKIFGDCLSRLVQQACFSKEFEQDILNFSQHPKATISRKSPLHRMLFQPADSNETLIELEKLAEGVIFSIPDTKRVYIKGNKRRTRYICKRTDNNRQYLVPSDLKVCTFE